MLLDKFDEAQDYFMQYLKGEKIRPNDYQSNRVYCAVANVILLTAIERSKKEKSVIDREYHDIFNLYTERGIQYITYLYQLTPIRLVYKTIDSAEDKFFIMMHLAEEAKAKGSIKYASHTIKKLLRHTLTLQKC